MQFKRTAIIAGLLVLTGFVLFYRLGDVPLADPDEPRYAESAREMIERGSVMVPYFNYAPRINKPVLYYWSICATYLVLGVSEFSARLPSALAAFAMLLAAFFFMKRFCGTGTAAWSALVMASSPLFFVPARLVMPDMLLGLVMVLSLFSFYLGWDEQDLARKRRWYFLFYFFQVVAAWIKGPVGILIPLGVAGISLWRERDRQELAHLRPGWGIPLVLVASVPWYLYIYLYVDQSAMTDMSTKETLGRFFVSRGRRFDPLYYYFLVVLAGMLPWAAVLPWVLRKRFRMPERNRLRSFLETWFVVVLGFFTLCAMKKPQYIIMLSCVSAAWLAMMFQQALPGKGGKRDIGLVASLFVLLAIAIVGSFKGLSWISKNQPELLAGGISLGFTFIIPSLAALWFAARNHGRAALVALSLVMVLSILPLLHQGTAWLEKHRSIKPFLQENEHIISQAREIYAGVKIFNGLPYYLRRQVIMNTKKDFLVGKLENTTPCIVFTSYKRYNRNKELFGKYLIVKKYGKVLLSNFASRGDGREESSH